ncbi:hypothetical protein KSS87_012203 [Heliosperma pusillum]|nr:hypothetical protein KSS87_012203 [Heliosperma pusillum]
MTEIDSPQQMDYGNEEQKLKYLEPVHTAALHSVLCFINIYGYAKDKTGSLKPGVESIEGAVKNVVDESVTKLDHRLPPFVKQASSQAYRAAQKTPEVARSVASQVQGTGVVDTASGVAKNVYTKYEPAAKELYSKYEPVAEQYVVSAWRSLNRLPLFPQVAQVMVPTAVFCSEKYNHTVTVGVEKGFRVSNYLPLVPTEKIAKVFEAPQAGESQAVVDGNSNAAAH